MYIYICIYVTIYIYIYTGARRIAESEPRRHFVTAYESCRYHVKNSFVVLFCRSLLTYIGLFCIKKNYTHYILLPHMNSAGIMSSIGL